MNQEDSLLLYTKVKEGDTRAFEALFKQHYAQIHHFANRFLKNEVLATEVAQEIFMYLWEKRHKIRIQSTFKSYLFSATKNKCLNYLKLEVSKQQATVSLENSLLVANSENSEETKNKVIRQHIDIAIDTLPKKCKLIFVMSRNGGMTYDEIAQELNLSKKTVENQMGIALKKLRESLSKVYEHFKNDTL